MNPLKPPRPDRIRTVEKPFAWIPFRILTDGFLTGLTHQAKLLYLFLCLAADRHGLSFWGDDRICESFKLCHADISLARNELIEKDLIAHDGRLYQILSLPHPKQPQKSVGFAERHAEPQSFADILKHLAQSIPTK